MCISTKSNEFSTKNIEFRTKNIELSTTKEFFQLTKKSIFSQNAKKIFFQNFFLKNAKKIFFQNFFSKLLKTNFLSEICKKRLTKNHLEWYYIGKNPGKMKLRGNLGEKNLRNHFKSQKRPRCSQQFFCDLKWVRGFLLKKLHELPFTWISPKTTWCWKQCNFVPHGFQAYP